MPPPLHTTLDVCNAVDAAIRSLVGPTIDVQKARHSSLMWSLTPRGDGVVWSYDGKLLIRGGPLGDRGRQMYRYRFTIAAVGMDWSSPAGANEKACALADLIQGTPGDAAIEPASDRPPNLRSSPLGTIGPDTLWLAFQGEQTQLLGATTAWGGREAFVQSWVTDTESWA